MAVIPIANFGEINFDNNVNETYVEVVFKPPEFVFKSYLVEFAGGGADPGGGESGGAVGYPIG